MATLLTADIRKIEREEKLSKDGNQHVIAHAEKIGNGVEARAGM